MSSTSVIPTPIEEIREIRTRLRTTFATGRTRDVAFRKTQLLQLAYLLEDHRDDIAAALKKDLHRDPFETDMFEFISIKEGVLRAHSNIAKWAAPEGTQITLMSLLASPTVYKEPKGVVLIVGPFNYPIFCNFSPLIGAIAAGCGAVIKPSEASPAIATLLAELIPKYLDPELYAVVNGAVPETKELLSLQWDHIFFTGSTAVGKIVARAAAEHLTPVTLELGGKNPSIVDKDVDIDATVRKLLWAKNGNAGQTCTAPDYTMVHKDVHAAFLDSVRKAYAQFYPDPERQHQQQTHVVNAGAYKRMADLLTRTKGTIIAGAGLTKADATTNYIPLTVVDVERDDVLMEHEIFGPIWPIMAVDSMEEATRYAQARESPLGVYVYTNNSKTMKYVRENTRSGAIVQGDSIIQGAMYGLPFGGVGASGYGAQGGKHSFDLFTYLRASVTTPSFFEKLLAVRYPPYTERKKNFVTLALIPKVGHPRPGTRSWPWSKLVASFAAVLGVIAAYGYRTKFSS